MKKSGLFVLLFLFLSVLAIAATVDPESAKSQKTIQNEKGEVVNICIVDEKLVVPSTGYIKHMPILATNKNYGIMSGHRIGLVKRHLRFVIES